MACGVSEGLKDERGVGVVRARCERGVSAV